MASGESPPGDLPARSSLLLKRFKVCNALMIPSRADDSKPQVCSVRHHAFGPGLHPWDSRGLRSALKLALGASHSFRFIFCRCKCSACDSYFRAVMSYVIGSILLVAMATNLISACLAKSSSTVVVAGK